MKNTVATHVKKENDLKKREKKAAAKAVVEERKRFEKFKLLSKFKIGDRVKYEGTGNRIYKITDYCNNDNKKIHFYDLESTEWEG